MIQISKKGIESYPKYCQYKNPIIKAHFKQIIFWGWCQLLKLIVTLYPLQTGSDRKTNSSYNKHFYLKTEKEESLMFYDLKLSSCKKYKLQQQYNTTIQFYNTKYGANIDKHNPYCLISIPNLINWTAASRGKGKLFFANFLKIL